MTRTRKIGILATVLGMGVFASSAGATVQNFFGFDPDGTGGLGTLANVASFDWAVDNALSVGGNTAIANFIAGAGPTTFNTYYQAKLTGIHDTSNANILPAGFLGSSPTMEITVIAGFQEEVTGFSGALGSGSASFKSTGATGAGIANFFAIYFDSTPEASPLTGLGYDDGTLIIDGTINADGVASTTFTDLTPTGGPYVPLDGYTSNYLANQSIEGIGQSKLHATPGLVNTDFFKNIPVLMTLVNTTNTLNFTEVDPSARFYFSEGGPAMLAGAGNGTTDLGTINGLNGPDVQFQSDGSQSFTVEGGIPEPVTATLGMLGLGALGLVISRHRAV